MKVQTVRYVHIYVNLSFPITRRAPYPSSDPTTRRCSKACDRSIGAWVRGARDHAIGMQD